jgi:hypothetical protein
LYFGLEDNEERALKLGKNSISMIMTNNTRKFKESFVLEVFSKILITLTFELMDLRTHPSNKSMRFFAHIHS